MSLTGAKLQSLDMLGRFRTVEGPVDVLLAKDLVAQGLDIQKSLGSHPWPQGYKITGFGVLNLQIQYTCIWAM